MVSFDNVRIVSMSSSPSPQQTPRLASQKPRYGKNSKISLVFLLLLLLLR
jgi:hypothetical protein